MSKINKKDTLLLFVLFVNLYLSEFFFSICAILGLDFYSEEADTVPYFVYTYMIMDVIVLISFLRKLIMYGANLIDYSSFLLIATVLILFFLDPPSWHEGVTIFKSFVAKSIPAMMVASIVSARFKLAYLIRNFDILVVLLSIAMILNFPKYLLGSIAIGGAGYQALAYFSAIAFSLNLYMIVAGDDTNRYEIFKSEVYKLLSYFFLAVQVVTCLISGGRGGAVLIIASTLFLFWRFLRDKLSKLFLFIVFFLSFAYFVSTLMPNEYGEILQKGFERSFSYITESGVDMSATSNRDLTYTASLNAIAKSPVVGYGLFKYIDVNKFYPHNFFLEILMQGGCVYMIVMLTFLVYLYSKYNSLTRVNVLFTSIGIIAIYPFFYLLFSGSYIGNPIFWFSIFLILHYNLKARKYSRL